MSQDNQANMMSENIMRNFMAEVKRLQDENKRLQVITKNYTSFASKLVTMSDELKALAKQIDPILNTQQTRMRKDRTELRETIFERMKSGQRVTSDWIWQFYKEEFDNMQDVYNFMGVLKKMPGVQLTKNGRQTTLYL